MPTPSPKVREKLSASMMRVRQKSAFFQVLASYLKPIEVPENDRIQTAATDGLRLYINPTFWLSLTDADRDFVLVHEVLHAALGHCWRVGGRHRFKWNVAADYVINLIATKAGFKMPTGDFEGLLDQKYDKMSVEEVYALLPTAQNSCPICGSASCGQGDQGNDPGNDPGDNPGGNTPGNAPGSGGCRKKKSLGGDILPNPGGAKEGDKHWNVAKASAATVAKMYGSGHSDEYLKVVLEESVTDWRQILWRTLSHAPSDFKEWDHRFVSDELYVESIEPEETLLKCAICIDTSGSTYGILGKFLGEVKQIVSLYKQIDVSCYFADDDIIGPVPIEEVFEPRGGGGTSFVPFFDEVVEKKYERAIYLTDLEGVFPKEAPSNCEVIWVVPAGSPHSVPFGEIVRIIEE
jgi:predicted metal-dependent peptidase